ncbi:MAG TPA: hypothetical protein VG269_26760 [Tepidisphaeraceae bacterium]|jgi:hypothetical protein|nr:hypothetical protein [Tepidisphaeraceae bacterium]
MMYGSFLRSAHQQLLAHATATMLAAICLSFSGPPAPAAVPAFRQHDYPPHTFVKARRRKLKGYERGKKRSR